MKKTIAIPLFLVLVGSLSAQNVVELSRREKARRESFKNSRVQVVTNVDLTALHKAPAITITQDSTVSNNAEPSAGPGPNPANTAPVRTMVPNVVSSGPRVFESGDSSGPGSSASSGNLEARLKAASELVDLLTTKMNALWQEFYAQNTMTPQDVLQQRLDETYKKLVQAQEEEAKLKAQIEAGKGKSAEKH